MKGSVRLWDKKECGLIMNTCIILHNMIVENEEDPEEWAPPKGKHVNLWFLIETLTYFNTIVLAELRL